MELTRSKISVDHLTLRQREGFLSVLPVGANQFGAQYERVLPASSAAKLYPFNFSGKTNPQGVHIGRDKFGTSTLVDFDRRAEDKTTFNILILGNSGQGKSYLLKLILTNLRESGKSIICIVGNRSDVHICRFIGHFASAVFDNKLQPFHIGVLIAVNNGWGSNHLQIKLVDRDIPERLIFSAHLDSCPALCLLQGCCSIKTCIEIQKTVADANFRVFHRNCGGSKQRKIYCLNCRRALL